MRKSYVLLFIAVITLATNAFAQRCYTDEMYQHLLQLHPDAEQARLSYDAQIKAAIKKLRITSTMRTTDAAGNTWYDIPIVVHIVHDYGITASTEIASEYLPDDSIYNAVKEWNIVYAGANPDTSTVIPAFKKYIGNPHIRLHLATIDPSGKPTHGITRHRSYLTYPGSDQSKLDDWSPTNYVNIWLVNDIANNPDIIAYAYFPSEISPTYVSPSYDGVIGKGTWAENQSQYAYQPPYYFSKVINHEIGHVMSLYHPWGTTNDPCVACGDDAVDDTPPTKGHCASSSCTTTPEACGCTSGPLYDTACATDYFVVYPSSKPGIDSIADYPDTANSQNIMDYTECSRMFTIGQTERMWAALNSDQAGRDSLWTTNNLIQTGVIDTSHNYINLPDLLPIAEFSAVSNNAGAQVMQYFTCPGTNLKFINKTWNDTVTSLTWTFGNGASTPTVTQSNPNFSTSVSNNFSVPGWLSFTMTPTGNHLGGSWDTSYVFNNSVFIANTAATPGNGYYQEFNPSGDVASWPMFNYYNNEFKWELSDSTGYYDNYCMKYDGYDLRLNAYSQPLTGQPMGDFDDFYTVPVDLTSFMDTVCNLNYMYSGASRSSLDSNLTDTMVISYSTDHAVTWTTLKVLSGSDLDNNGAYANRFMPSPGDQSKWAPMTIPLPTNIKNSNYTIFRFRYKPGINYLLWEYYGNNVYESAGNNFYMDRLNFSSYPAEVSSVLVGNDGVAVAPNPTKGNAFVIIKGAANTKAKIVVTDVSGRVVFTANQQLGTNDEKIEIPQSYISVKGVYMVEVSTGNISANKKLVVY